jgi:hypothetical protein
VHGCLGTLQGSQQQSISLAYYQGLSHGEIAAHLGAPLGSVKTWVRRGLIALKACLERCGWSEATVMNLIPGDLPDRLAAEYVLGTLTGGARRRFDALLPAHPALRHAVAAWESRLLPMALKAEAVQPDARVWRSIESQLGWTAPAAATPASPLAPALLAGCSPRSPRWPRWCWAPCRAMWPTEAPMIVVLHATKGSETLVAGLSPDRQQLTIQPLQKVSLTSDQSLELWALKKDGAAGVAGRDRGRQADGDQQAHVAQGHQGPGRDARTAGRLADRGADGGRRVRG